MENQKVQQAVVDKIEELIPLVWIHLTGASSGSQMSNVNEWSKRVDCWNKLKLRLGDLEKFDEDLLQKEINEDGSGLNDTQKNRIAEAESYSPQFWFALANWARENNMLTPIDRKAAFNFGTMRSRGRKFVSLKQAMYALKIANTAKEHGFEE